MRGLRWIVGILALLVAIPAAAGGVVAWWVMRHPSPDGAFHADLVPIERPDRVLVVPDLDALLRRDAPYARVGETTLRLSVSSGGTPAFLGVADPGRVAEYLAGVRYTEISQVQLGRGQLPVRTQRVEGQGAQGAEPADPEAQDLWQRQGIGSLSWRPGEDRGRRVALVVVLRDGTAAGHAAHLDVAVHADWVRTASWGLLILGIVALTLGYVLLAWPSRPVEDRGAVTAAAGPPPVVPAGRTPTVELAAAVTDPAAGPVPIVPGLNGRDAAPMPIVPGLGGYGTGPGRVVPVFTSGEPARADAAPGTLLVSPARLPLQPRTADERPWPGTPPAGAPCTAETVFQAVAGGGPAPAAAPLDLVWPPRRRTEPPVTEPVREVVTEELPPVPFLPRPACTLRLHRDRVPTRG
ncbi:hypothetical protein Cs7R123_30160 [Catellatospora sp. TT07R-123]|uniref:hypothetical protein n=1 Tax=Catellatospora sp. TT07R-123 TaxID=2733863 RepID=UPI001B1C8E9B|nr:hypothetical protein [Catellatospora sp. TT07R-123]GHJ45674.1 hypothetical protein Cs7R123_30160 [Catellatospora sp. TT07R-123]